MKKPAGRVQPTAKSNGNGHAHAPKKESLPSIDVLIRKICRTHTTVGIVVKK